MRNRQEENMNAKRMQTMLNETAYYDSKVLDLQVRFSGDEVTIWYEAEGDDCWQVEFLFCHQLEYQYKTDVDWRKLPDVKKMDREQLNGYVQDIQVRDSEIAGFCDVRLDLNVMELFVRCKDVALKKVKENDTAFFWRENEVW